MLNVTPYVICFPMWLYRRASVFKTRGPCGPSYTAHYHIQPACSPLLVIPAVDAGSTWQPCCLPWASLWYVCWCNILGWGDDNTSGETEPARRRFGKVAPAACLLFKGWKTLTRYSNPDLRESAHTYITHIHKQLIIHHIQLLQEDSGESRPPQI